MNDDDDDFWEKLKFETEEECDKRLAAEEAREREIEEQQIADAEDHYAEELEQEQFYNEQEQEAEQIELERLQAEAEDYDVDLSKYPKTFSLLDLDKK